MVRMAGGGGKGDLSSLTPVNSTPFLGGSAQRNLFLKQVLFWSAQTKVLRGTVTKPFRRVAVMVGSLTKLANGHKIQGHRQYKNVNVGDTFRLLKGEKPLKFLS